MGLWKDLEDKLNKAGRKWEESPDYIPYRYAYLFCVKCGIRLGRYDIVCTDLDHTKYCFECAKEYIKETPYEIPIGTVIRDRGLDVVVQYKNGYYDMLQLEKYCYFGKRGRYIKYKGKRYYL